MKIAYITAGAANMYCGSCIHDNALAAALKTLGHDVLLIPTYTPLRTDEENVSVDRVFYGGINVYLQQKSSFFRRTPWFVDSLLNNRILLSLASGFSSSTSARSLGELTVSMLEGESGPQKKELEKLLSWLDQEKPDIVQLTNSLFVGLTRPIKERLGVPVLCALQGEDIFIEGLVEPYHSQVRNLLIQQAAEIDGFIATSHYYADFMARYLQVDEQKIDVVYLGINLDGYSDLESSDDEAHAAGGKAKIGYMARVCPEKGLHLLAEAFIQLTERWPASDLQLAAAGYLAKTDQEYLRKIEKRLVTAGLGEKFKYEGELERDEKIAFLKSLDILSVPTTYVEPKGLFVLEALAAGVSVVQPEHGSFPELLEKTGGGLLVEPGSPEALSSGLEKLLNNPEQRKKMARNGKAVVFSDFSDRVMATATLRVYQRYL